MLRVEPEAERGGEPEGAGGAAAARNWAGAGAGADEGPPAAASSVIHAGSVRPRPLPAMIVTCDAEVR